jgi:diguanylate cyclase (GGDEF)-like protein/PAS domain S-box-containing protein
MADPRPRGRLERLIFLPVVAALIGVWAILISFTLEERRFMLGQVTSELSSTLVTLADFNELAELAAEEAVIQSSARRTAAMWRALLRYPTAAIWVESGGTVVGGQPPITDADASIRVEETRDTFSVHAALPLADALADWQRSAWQRAVILLVASIAFLVLTVFLMRAMRQRSTAEQEVAAAQEREAQLARYKTLLEETVAERTGELMESTDQLEKELVERKAAQAELQQHDALLRAAAKSAAELLGAHSHEEATATVLELIGQTIGVSRAHINEITTDSDGHLCSSIRHEWCAPGMSALIDNPALHDLDLTAALPRIAEPLLIGGLKTFFVDELDGPLKELFERSGMRSFLQIPVLVEDKLWGSITFIDSADQKRQWSWAETDTLQTLAGLIGAAITRARYVKELADANMIVQNSPTILYRVRGEPPFPLIYVSHNITKFGHDSAELVGAPNWTQLLMDSEDEKKIVSGMARTLEKNAKGATIEFRLRTGDGTHRWVENRYTPVRDKHGRLVEIEGMIIDVTERKTAEDKIAQLARTDGLTGLANRVTFIERLRQTFAGTQRGANPFAILYLDLDHFKAINDTLGHPMGDLLLKEVADRLRSCTRDNDVVARLGGDEFAILQTDMNEPANAGALAATIQAVLNRPYLIDGNDLHVTVSIGICPYVPDSTGPDAMLAQADLALYRSKDEGRNRYRFHSDDLDHEVLERVTLTVELRTALEHGELELHYQPQVELATGKIVGMEAFMRWHHPSRGLLSASAFVPVAEKTGAIIPLGQWALDQACGQMRQWRDQGVNPPPMTLNLSLAQLKNSRELLDDVRTALETWKLEPSDLSFDVTEATLAHVTLMHNNVLAELRRIGVSIAIDNFGSAYSSFDYLRTYGVSHLKITPAFLDDAEKDPERASTVRAIIKFARELGIGVVTQGVETEEQLDLTSSTSIIAQGYFFSEALAAEEAHKLLKQGSITLSAEPGDGGTQRQLSALLEGRKPRDGDEDRPRRKGSAPGRSHKEAK